MCLDPITLGLIGAATSAVGTAAGMSQQAAAQSAQAKMHDRQAQIERISGSYRAERESDNVRRQIGAGVAAASASGVRLTGTTGAAVREIGTEGAMDVAATRFGTRVAADNEGILASVARTNAKNTRAGIPFAVAQPFIGFASSNPSMFTSSGGGLGMGRPTRLSNASAFSTY